MAIRLKTPPELGSGNGTTSVKEQKGAVLAYYCDHLIASRSPVPQGTRALGDFVGSFVNAEDLVDESELVRAMEKALLRSPEVSLATLDAFFKAYVSPVSTNKRPNERAPPQGLIVKKLLPAILASAKSTDKTTRTSATLLFDTLVSPFLASPQSGPANFILQCTKEVGAPLRTMKSASSEHRVALCQLLLSLTTSNRLIPEVLLEILHDLCASLTKETNENALKATLKTFVAALRRLLQDGIADGNVISVITRGISDKKANIRSRYLEAVGEIFWHFPRRESEPSKAAKDVAKACLPGLETALRNAGTAVPGFATDGWIAVAILKGVFSTREFADAPLTENPILQGLLVAPHKGSFLLAERFYRKSASEQDEVWLVRALESVLKTELDMRKVTNESHLR